MAKIYNVQSPVYLLSTYGFHYFQAIGGNVRQIVVRDTI